MGGNYAVTADGKFFGGSSLLKCVELRNGAFTIAPKFLRKQKLDEKILGYAPHVSLSECLPHSVVLQKNAENERVKVKAKREFTFNRKAIYTRALVFSDLEQSKKFLAFYTISFPAGTTDDKCRQALHTLLVRLKETFNLRGYVLVCERQKNGTLHYHMLVNDHMPVRYSDKDDPDYKRPSVNSFLQMTLYNLGVYTTIGERNPDGSLKDEDARKFNGVDVELVVKDGKCVQRNKRKEYAIDEVKKRVLGYLIKYISKGEKTKWDFRPWRCSHSVSCLFTSAYVNHNVADLVNVEVEYNMWATVYRWQKATKQKALQLAYANLNRLNSVLYDIVSYVDGNEKFAEFLFAKQKAHNFHFRFNSDGTLHHYGGTIEFTDDEYIAGCLLDSTSLCEEETDFEEENLLNDFENFIELNCPF